MNKQCPNCSVTSVEIWQGAFPTNRIYYICSACRWVGTKEELEAIEKGLEKPQTFTRDQALKVAYQILRGREFDGSAMGLWGYRINPQPPHLRHDLNWLADILVRISAGETSNEEILKEVGQ